MEELNKLTTEVMAKLTVADEEVLLACINGMMLPVPKPKVASTMVSDNYLKNLYLKTLMRYISSEEVEEAKDGGLSVLSKLNDILTRKSLKVGGLDTMEYLQSIVSKLDQGLKAGKETVGGSKVSKMKDETETVGGSKVFKWKEFKISGTIGSVGQKDKLSYSSLSFQIQSAKEAGYPDCEIVAAVIKSISPGIPLRTYLENRGINLKLPSLIAVMRSHYKEKDSSSTFTELSNAVQGQHESALEFTMRLFEST